MLPRRQAVVSDGRTVIRFSGRRGPESEGGAEELAGERMAYEEGKSMRHSFCRESNQTNSVNRQGFRLLTLFGIRVGTKRAHSAKS